MKRFKIIFFILLLSGSSCKKFLDVEPTDFLSPENFYNTEDDLNYALNAVYSQLTDASTYGANMWTYFDIADEMFWSLQSTGSTVPLIVAYNYNASDPNIRNLWQTLYKGVGDANLLLANINKPTMDSVKRSEIEGQALFLRSYYYFLLVQNWGGVPLVLEPVTSPDDVQRPRTSAREIYNQILNDMTRAEAMVPSMSTVGFGGRVTKSAVRGILARVCLHMAGEPLKDVSKYTEARDWALKVIEGEDFKHELNPSFEQIFINYAQDKYDAKETIWEVEFWGNRQDSYQSSGRLGTRNGIEMRNDDLGIGWSYGQLGALGRQYRRYTAGDFRRDWAIAPFSYNEDTGAKSYYAPTSNFYQRKVAKWRREYETLLPKNKNYSPQNFPLLRYSDVLLMYAEAENELTGDTEEGRLKVVEAIEKVRRRGFGKDAYGERILRIDLNAAGAGYNSSTTTVNIIGGGGSGASATISTASARVSRINIVNPGSFYTSVPTVTITSTAGGTGATATAVLTTPNNYLLSVEQKSGQDDLRETIKEERSRELCFEGLRKMDLIRWGSFINNVKQVAVEVQNEAGASYASAAQAGMNITPTHLLFPIPIYELSLNRLLTQNPGW